MHRVELPVTEQDEQELRALGDMGGSGYGVPGEGALERGAEAGVAGWQAQAAARASARAPMAGG